MNIIINFSDIIKRHIGFQEYQNDKRYNISPYIVSLEDDILLYNSLTCELIKLDDKEKESQFQYLVEHWFYFSEDVDPYSFVKSLKMIYKEMNKPKYIESIRKYTIMTTMACNARCPYCYEAGCSMATLSPEMALDVAKFIRKHSIAYTPVWLSWFGGEPLLNTDAIKIICGELRKAEIAFSSSIITNGYLFSKQDIKDINLWNLKSVQISLDGTNEIYKQTKNYIYNDEDPLDVVLQGISMLLKNDINVVIRLNVSRENVNDLKKLVEMLCGRYRQYKNFRIYTHLLFNEDRQEALSGNFEIRELLKENDLYALTSIGRPNLLSYCMADNKHDIVITPRGDLTLCEHFSDSEIVGNIYDGIVDLDTVKEWSKAYESNGCKSCCLYPRCTKIQKCPLGECNDIERATMEYQIKSTMLSQYRRFQRNKNM